MLTYEMAKLLDENYQRIKQLEDALFNLSTEVAAFMIHRGPENEHALRVAFEAAKKLLKGD